MKNFIFTLLILLVLPVTAMAASGDHIEAIQPYEYTEAVSQANADALKCAQLTAAIVISLDVITVDIKNDRGLAEVACMNAYKILNEIRTKLEQQPYDPNGLTINPTP